MGAFHKLLLFEYTIRNRINTITLTHTLLENFLPFYKKKMANKALFTSFLNCFYKWEHSHPEIVKFSGLQICSQIMVKYTHNT